MSKSKKQPQRYGVEGAHNQAFSLSLPLNYTLIATWKKEEMDHLIYSDEDIQQILG